MEMDKCKLIVERPYKKVYHCEDSIIKLFSADHPKVNVFNEAMENARVEECGLDIPRLQKVENVGGQWALFFEYREGKTLEEMMKVDSANIEKYMDDFVGLQLEVQSKKAPALQNLKEKLSREINGITDLDASQRYELLMRLDGMLTHYKLCHGDFNPSNIIVGKTGKMAIVDWAHATQGNGSADAAMTYLLFALKDQETADLYLKMYCKKADVAIQYVQQWLPIVAASQLAKNHAMEKDFLMKWIDVMDYQ